MLPTKLTETPQETEHAVKIDCIINFIVEYVHYSILVLYSSVKLKHSLYVGHTVQTIVSGSGKFKRMP